MATASYDVLFPQCLVELPGAAVPLVVNALNNAAMRLCRRVPVWQEWQDVTLETGIESYALDAPSSSARVHAVQEVILDGRRVHPVSLDDISRNSPSLLTQNGSPAVCWINQDGELRLAPIPAADDAGKTLRVLVAFLPALGASGFDARLLEKHGALLAAGAKAELMRIPGQAFSNPQLGLYYEREFARLLDDAAIDAMHSEVRGPLRVQPRAFGS